MIRKNIAILIAIHFKISQYIAIQNISPIPSPNDEDITLTFGLSEICEFHLMAPCGEVYLNLLSNVICGYKSLWWRVFFLIRDSAKGYFIIEKYYIGFLTSNSAFPICIALSLWFLWLLKKVYICVFTDKCHRLILVSSLPVAVQ